MRREFYWLIIGAVLGTSVVAFADPSYEEDLDTLQQRIAEAGEGKGEDPRIIRIRELEGEVSRLEGKVSTLTSSLADCEKGNE